LKPLPYVKRFTDRHVNALGYEFKWVEKEEP
jgi:hypothetical protein